MDQILRAIPKKRITSLGVLSLWICCLIALVIVCLSPSPTAAQTSVEIDLTPVEQSILPGTQATFTITIRNTGAVTLTTIGVSSPAVYQCSITLPYQVLPDLAPGDPPIVYSCTSDYWYVDIEPEVVVTALPSDGRSQVTASASAIVHVEHLLVQKMPELQSVDSGAPATFTIRVANTGGFTLTDIAVSDPLVPDCARTVGELTDLGPDGTQEYTCHSGALYSRFENRVEATAVISPAGVQVTDRSKAVAQVRTPLSVTVSPEEQFVPLGDRAEFMVRLVNTGNSRLTEVAVSDPAAPDCARSAGELASLPAAGSLRYVCHSEPITGSLRTDAAATASDGGAHVEASTSATVYASPLVLSVQPPYPFAPRGQIVTFTVTITNLHSSHVLTNVIVSTEKFPDCNRAEGELPGLESGGHVSYTCQTDPLSHYLRDLVQVTAIDAAVPVDADAAVFADTAEAHVGIYDVPIVVKEGEE